MNDAGTVPPRPDGRGLGYRPDMYAGSPLVQPSAARAGAVAASGWNRFVGIVGVVTGFLFLLTIPGWVALSSYRKWRRGQVSGRGLMVWGYISIGLWLLAIVSIASGPSPSG